MGTRTLCGKCFSRSPKSIFANEVAGEIAFGCENYGFPHDDIVTQVERTATELQINNLLEEKVRYLSYGMRQRVAIASAKAIDRLFTLWMNHLPI